MRDHSKSLVNVEDLVIAFRNPARRAPFHAVDHVSLSIGAGEVLGLVGESGSGKTTLAKAVLRLYQPTAGRVVFDGTDITRLGEAFLRPIRRKMQMVFQDPLSSFNPRVRIGDAVSLPLRLHRLCKAREIDARVDQLLTQVGLGHQFRGRYPHEMSGGQLQRVAIARALALQPRLIVADEPVSKLDVSVRAQILNLLREVQKSSGVALLFITHDLRVARYLCDRIGVMFFGRLIEIGPSEEAFARPRHPYTRALLSTLDEVSGIDITIEPPLPANAEGCHYRTRCPIAKTECARDRPALAPVRNGHQLVACPYVLEN
jgi:peptide/nickel transport system ATP-binding protein/oligopeptide transport system ATP-binding protein